VSTELLFAAVSPLLHESPGTSESPCCQQTDEATPQIYRIPLLVGQSRQSPSLS
jgi:hypothetical protein